MIRRFVNLVAANHDRCVYSLHRLDVAKHLFYPSTADAEAANAVDGGGGGDKPRRPSRIGRLRRLPEPIVRFQQLRPAYNDAVFVEDPRRFPVWSPPDEMFALLSPRGGGGRIFHATDAGHAVLYDAGGGGDDSASAGSAVSTTLPSLGTPTGYSYKPIAIPIASAAAAEDDDDDDGRRRHGKEEAEKESIYVINTHYAASHGHTHSFHVLDISHHHHPPKWDPLPPPPFAAGESVNSIASFTVIDGVTICVSTRENHTYCFDTRRHRWWHAGGDWMLPFGGRAEHVAELGAWLGLRFSWTGYSYDDGRGQLCASSDLRAAVRDGDGREPTLRHVWEEFTPPPPEEESLQLSRRFNGNVIERRKQWRLLRGDMINLGGGRFCTAKVFQVQQAVRLGYESDVETHGEFVVLTSVEVLRAGDGEEGELRMVRHRSKRYMFTDHDIIQWVL